jgi:hypothetical protein
MFGLIQKNKLQKQLSKSIVKNCLFDAAIIYKKRAQAMRGIKLCFKDNTQGVMWALDSNKYIFNYGAFDTFIRIPLTRDQGDQVWAKFLSTFQGKYEYEDV